MARPSCGLTLAGLLGGRQLDHAVTERLHDVVDKLDGAIREIRNAVFAQRTDAAPEQSA